MNDDWPSYPPDDHLTYLSWFEGRYPSVFVAPCPFLRQPSCTPDEPGTAVSWSRVAKACGFPTIAHVNRALRLTGSKRIVSKLADAADTEAVLAYCQTAGLTLPEEGFLSPSLCLSIADFLDAAGCQNVTTAGHFGVSPAVIAASKFREQGKMPAAEILALDRSFFMTIHTDYHYLLICQTTISRETVDPSAHFDGFFATETTNDFWGVGELPPFHHSR